MVWNCLAGSMEVFSVLQVNDGTDIRRWDADNGKKVMANIMGPNGSFVTYNLGPNADIYVGISEYAVVEGNFVDVVDFRTLVQRHEVFGAKPATRVPAL